MGDARAYTSRLEDALGYAAALHAGQWRKSTSTPYLSHLLAVCALVLEDDGSEDEAIAALLHDAVEDQGGLPVLDAIRTRYGDTVAEIVWACSDSVQRPRLPWLQRKEGSLRQLATAAPGALRVTAADKLHNTLATLQDRRSIGAGVWGRFNAGAQEFLWYHRSVEQILISRLPASRSLALLQIALAELEGLVADE